VATGLAAALAVLPGSILAGCGGDRYADYCAAVSAHQEQLTKTLGAGGPEALLKALPTFLDLQDKAPDDIADDWAVLTQALTDLDRALAAAGVDAADYDATKPPAGLSAAERDRIAAAATRVGGVRTQAALAAVDQQARDVCHAPLTL
jgi:hypothetical protein